MTIVIDRAARKFLRRVRDAETKVTRVAFLYLEPKPRDAKETFAQCASCRMFVPHLSRCIIHGSKQKIDEDDSCGFYVDWPSGSPNLQVIEDHAAELSKGIAGSVTPEESGLVDSKVQCQRCTFSEGTTCGLYRLLNKVAGDTFALDDKIKLNACCNAWTGE